MRRAQLVGRTELSYTYAQTPKEGSLYNLYHGTLEARTVTPTTSVRRESKQEGAKCDTNRKASLLSR
jgi:hypothetical protein